MLYHLKFVLLMALTTTTLKLSSVVINLKLLLCWLSSVSCGSRLTLGWLYKFISCICTCNDHVLEV